MPLKCCFRIPRSPLLLFYVQWKVGEYFPDFFYNFIFIYLLAVLGFCCCAGFSPVVMSRGSSLVVVCGLLPLVASPVADHGL